MTFNPLRVSRMGVIYSFVLLLIFQFPFPICVSAQFDEDVKFYPELSGGLKTAIGSFEYGARYFESTADPTVGFQPTIRYDYPIRLWTINEKTFYLNLTASTGLLYVSNKKRIYNDIDPVTNQPVIYQSKSPIYMPFYVGFYNPGPWGAGVEAFYAKGLNGISDIWGGKLLGLTYNHSKFRINAAYELAVPVKLKTDNPSSFFSIEFLWKFNPRDEY